MLAVDIAKLMQMIPQEEVAARQNGKDRIEGGAFTAVMNKNTPFMYGGGEGINAGAGETEWVVAKDQVHQCNHTYMRFKHMEGVSLLIK